jgi:hypothetical protein
MDIKVDKTVQLLLLYSIEGGKKITTTLYTRNYIL